MEVVMKRYVKAAWSGRIPLKVIMKETGLDKSEAEEFRQYLFEGCYDSGYETLADFLASNDLNEIYEEMFK